MTNQVLGRYCGHDETLLQDFDETALLVQPFLESRYGVEFSQTLQQRARQEYQKLIPDIPYIKGMRAKILNRFLLITAQELAVYLSMKAHGRTPGEAWELCHEALRRRVSKIPRWKRWLINRFMFSSLMKNMMGKRAKERQRGRFGDFEVEYLIGRGPDFDWGINYLRCGNLHLVLTHGGEEFAPYICLSDVVWSEAFGWGLVRTQTLADGCQYCDFRFKKDGPTRISSRTTEVQRTIERIRKKDAGREFPAHYSP